MSIINPHILPKHLGPSLQESSSWAGKVVTKIYTTTNYAISSIDSVAKSILSNFIYVGTLGRYTLDDLKGYFSTRVPIENKRNSVLEEAKSSLKRHDSKVSVNSILLRGLRFPRDPQYPSIYPDLAGGVKLSTYSKNPEQRLAEMERAAVEKESVINKGE